MKIAQATIQALIEDKKLQPHPEGGHYAREFQSETLVSTDRGMRAASSRILYLLSGHEFSCFHQLQIADETWHYIHGNSDLVIHELNSSTGYSSHILNINNPLHTIESKSWFAASLFNPKHSNNSIADQYALCACTVAPGFDFRDFTLANQATLTAQFPEHQSIIERFTKDLPIYP